MLTVVCKTCGAGIWVNRGENAETALAQHDRLCGVE